MPEGHPLWDEWVQTDGIWYRLLTKTGWKKTQWFEPRPWKNHPFSFDPYHFFTVFFNQIVWFQGCLEFSPWSLVRWSNHCTPGFYATASKLLWSLRTLPQKSRCDIGSIGRDLVIQQVLGRVVSQGWSNYPSPKTNAKVKSTNMKDLEWLIHDAIQRLGIQ